MMTAEGMYRLPVVMRGRTQADENWILWVLSGLCTRILKRDDALALYEANAGRVDFHELTRFCSSIGTPFRDVVEVVAMAFEHKRDNHADSVRLFAVPANHRAVRTATQENLVATLRGTATFLEQHPEWLGTVLWPDFESTILRIFSAMQENVVVTMRALNPPIERGRSKSLPSPSFKGRRKPPTPELIGEILYERWCKVRTSYALAKDLQRVARYRDHKSALRQIEKWDSRARLLLTPL
jgi:hypothetical protein